MDVKLAGETYGKAISVAGGFTREDEIWNPASI